MENSENKKSEQAENLNEGKWTLYKGTNWVDPQEQFGEDFNIISAAKIEAESRVDAEEHHSQTDVEANGYSISFEDPNSEKAKLYEALVQKWIEAEKDKRWGKRVGKK